MSTLQSDRMPVQLRISRSVIARIDAKKKYAWQSRNAQIEEALVEAFPEPPRQPAIATPALKSHGAIKSRRIHKKRSS